MTKYFFITFFLFSIGALAKDSGTPVISSSVEKTEVPAAKADAKANSKAHFSIGARTVSFQYEEPKFMKDTGLLSGIAGSFFYQFTEGGLVRSDIEMLSGKVDYNGNLQDGYGHKTPYSAEDQFQVLNLSSVGVFSSNFTQSFVTAPMLGLGYRNTFDGKDGEYDYRRDITYYYLIYGLQFELLNESRKVFLASVEYDSLLGGQAKTYLSDVNSRRKDIDLEFTTGSAIKIGFEFYYSLLDSGKIMTELSYKKWNLADSKLNDGWIEPANTTALTSLTLGYLF